MTPRLASLLFALAFAAVPAGCPAASPEPLGAPKFPQPGAPFALGELLYQDDFTKLDLWTPELEKGGTVRAQDGALEIDVPAGCTVWFQKHLDGPILIQYEATVIKAGGTNDRVSDLNCFWMARDVRSTSDIFRYHRSGKFADYNQLRTYYASIGGNANTTTRFRRYIGDPKDRPILPEHDLRSAEDLLVPNVPQTLSLVAFGNTIQFYRNDRKLFELLDPEPYTSGWFGLRTVTNHMRIRHFRIYRLVADPAETHP